MPGEQLEEVGFEQFRGLQGLQSKFDWEFVDGECCLPLILETV